MVRSREMTLSLPPFTRAVIWLLAANTAVFLLLELFSMALPDVVRWVFDYLSLVAPAGRPAWLDLATGDLQLHPCRFLALVRQHDRHLDVRLRL